MSRDSDTILFVGVGLTSAAAIATLVQGSCESRLLAMDVRPHVGGNCFDEADRGSRVHRYGPHLFHSPSPRIVEFLSMFTEWDEVRHAVTAEIIVDDRRLCVPFPYSKLTIDAIGRPLSPTEVAGVFFHGYSQKMWGQPWDELPAAVRARVPTNATVVPDRPTYFPGQFVAVPRAGYTPMVERMLDGCELRLGCGPRDWLSVKAKRVIYTGRPDLLPMPGSREATLGEVYGLELPYRTLAIRFVAERTWNAPTAVVNYCHDRVTYTRRTCYRLLTGGQSEIVSTETPLTATAGELAPFYPIISEENRQKYAKLKEVVQQHYPQLTLAGRLGTYQYLDMYQAVGQGRAIAQKL